MILNSKVYYFSLHNYREDNKLSRYVYTIHEIFVRILYIKDQREQWSVMICIMFSVTENCAHNSFAPDEDLRGRSVVLLQSTVVCEMVDITTDITYL